MRRDISAEQRGAVALDELLSPTVTVEASTQRRLCAITLNELSSIEFPRRELLLAPWLPSQGLAMVHAWRGVGKTHFALGVALAVAGGGQFLGWTADSPHKVLYLDGELPGEVLQQRSRRAARNTPSIAGLNLRFLTPDVQEGAMPDVSTSVGQQDLEAFLEGVKLIVVDNLSTLARSGGAENEAESWLAVADWALAQRRQQRSLLIVHHSGKNGTQRGTSKKEDILDTVINLKRPANYSPDQGAAFEVHFEKDRQFSGHAAKPFEARLTVNDRDEDIWALRSLDGTTVDRVAALLVEGHTQKEIAAELGLNKSSVSRAAGKVRERGCGPMEPDRS